MVEPEAPVLSLQGQPLAVDFIDNRLPKYHPAFRTGPKRYDQLTGRFVAVPMPGGPNPMASASPSAPAEPAVGSVVGGMPPQEVIQTLTYWSCIFPDAMAEFVQMPDVKPPKGRMEYEIRTDTTWIAVYNRLEAARAIYTKETGFAGTVRKVWRWTTDHAAEPLSVALKLAPKVHIATPVLGAIQIILEAAKTNTEVRKQSLAAFDDLEDVFSDVEVFLRTFPTEPGIKKRAVSLVAKVLLAVERGIGFFIMLGITRTAVALLRGKDYQSHLLNSLASITRDSKQLMAEAVKTHIRDFQEYSKVSMNIQQLINDGQEALAVEVKFVYIKVEELADRFDIAIDQNKQALATNNVMLAVLMDRHDKEREGFLEREKEWEERDRKQRDELAVAWEERVRLREALRSSSVSPYQELPWPPPQYPQPQVQMPSINQQGLWELLDILDLDTADMELIEERRISLPSKDRAMAEQIVENKLFQDWIVSPTSAKLLVHGNLSGPTMGSSALSLFCTTLTKAFRSKPRYLCLVWFCSQHLAPEDSDTDTDSSYDSDSDEDDGYMSEVEHNQFYGLGTRTRTIKRMLKSLIAQLLSDYDFGDQNLLPPEADLFLIQEGNLEQLSGLFTWLIGQLPKEITLFCLIDGIVFYEREEFEGPMLDVVADILALTADINLLAAVKVLVTSPWPTSIVRVAFEDEDDDVEGKSMILPMSLLSSLQQDPSDERVNRKLGQSY